MSATEYLVFDLRIEPEGPGYSARVVRSPAGEARVAFDDPFPAGYQHPALSRLARGAGGRAARHVEPAEGGDDADAHRDELARQIGEALYDAVFREGVGRCFVRSLDEAADQGKGVRIRLRLADVPELASLPWEYLYYPARGQFLVNSRLTPIVRYIDMEERIRPLQVRPPLSILVLIASPSDHPQLDVEQEWRNLKHELADLERRGLVELDRLDAANAAALQRRLRRRPVNIFHFIGHGTFDEASQRAALLFEDTDGRGQPLDADAVATLLHDHPPLRLVWLNACESGQASAAHPFAGVAQTLIRQGIPAAIAMQFRISDRAALVLSRAFYGALADGDPVDTALADARKAVYVEALGEEWGTPVLFMRAPDGQIFDLRETLPAQPPLEAPAEVPATPRPAEAMPGPTSPAPAPMAITPDVAPPPLPQLPAAVPGFVGRAAELARLGAALDEHHAVLLTGMNGVGKTALAITLARQAFAPERVFWHTFRAGEGPDAVLWRMAGFLAHQGQGRVWEMLETARRMGSQPPPAEVLFDYLLQLTRGQGYLLVLDDLHHVDTEPLIETLVTRLRGSVAEGEVSLLALTDRLPPFEIHHAEIMPLAGLSLDDTRALLAHEGVSLPVGQAAILHQRTGGTAQFLVLAIQALQRTSNPAHLIDHLTDVGNIERHLLQEVYKRLIEPERTVMRAVSVLLDQPGTRGAVEAVLGGSLPRAEVRGVLADLCDRYLLTSQEGATGDTYLQHALVQPFFYGDLDDTDRLAMHGRAGAYYGEDEVDPLLAARHLALAGDPARAAKLLLGNVWGLVNQGRAADLKALLARIEPDSLEPEIGADLYLARGEVSALVGDATAARSSFEAALERAAALPKGGAVPLLEARACRGRGDAVMLAAPSEALIWYRRGLTALGTKGAPDDPERRLELAALQVQMGAVFMAQAEYSAALASLEQAQALLPPEPSQLRAGLLLNLASVHGSQGDLGRAKAFAREGLQVCEEIFDDFRRTELLMNLALILDLQGEWDTAKANYIQALEIAERIGDATRQARLALNLGILATNLGDDHRAEAELIRCVDLARAGDLGVVLIAGLSSLADLRLRQGMPAQAEPLLAEAESLATAMGSRWQEPEIARGWSLVKLARGDTAGATEAVDRSLALAQELGLDAEEGRSLRVRGQVLAATAGPKSVAADELAETFGRSAELLAAEEPYEAARTKLAWAEALMAAPPDGDTNTVQRAEGLAREARLAFKALGARRDEAAAAAVLRAVEG